MKWSEAKTEGKEPAARGPHPTARGAKRVLLTDMEGGVNPLEVRKMIEANRDKMLIIRRRDFEVESLVRHIWAHKQIGRHLPDTIPPGTSFSDLRDAVLTIIFADGASSAGGGAHVEDQVAKVPTDHMGASQNSAIRNL